MRLGISVNFAEAVRTWQPICKKETSFKACVGSVLNFFCKKQIQKKQGAEIK